MVFSKQFNSFSFNYLSVYINTIQQTLTFSAENTKVIRDSNHQAFTKSRMVSNFIFYNETRHSTDLSAPEKSGRFVTLNRFIFPNDKRRWSTQRTPEGKYKMKEIEFSCSVTECLILTEITLNSSKSSYAVGKSKITWMCNTVFVLFANFCYLENVSVIWDLMTGEYLWRVNIKRLPQNPTCSFTL